MHDVHEHLTKELHECLHSCEECHDACLHAIQHCLKKGGKHAAPEHIRLLQDCVQICHTTSGFILRGSALHAHTCEACAAVCAACADSCERLGDDEVAQHCRECAESCGKHAHAHVD